MTSARRKKALVAMATQTEQSPHEAAAAKSALAKIAATPEGLLVSLSADVKALWASGIEGHFAIGRKLMEARALFPGHAQDQAFGRWVKEQVFPFGRMTAGRLRMAAEREPEVRAFLAARSTSIGRGGGELSPTTAIAYMNRRPPAPSEAGNQFFLRFRGSVYGLLGWEVDDDMHGKPTRNELLELSNAELRVVATLLQAMLVAYQQAREARA